MTKGDKVRPIRLPEVVVEVGGVVDECHATLGIHGPDLDPTEISTLLGCASTSGHRRGDPRGHGIPPWPAGAWLLTVESQAPIEPDALVALLLGRLPVDTSIWKQLRQQYVVRITFAIFVADWNRGFEFSAASVGRLAAIGAPVAFDIYADG